MFLTEKHLIIVLKSNFAPICHWNTKKFDTNIMEEVDLGFGIADLVISKMKPRFSEFKETLTYFDTIIYKIIENKKRVSFEKLKEITKADVSSINKALDKLIKESYINKKDSLITLRKSYQGVISDTIAIEAKLKNWKRALNQAFRYQWFAKKSFVVLDSINIGPAIKNIEEFKRYNVGLAEINNSGNLILHFKPVKANPIDYKMWILLNETLKNHFILDKRKDFQVER
jgi:hypothetical protein